MRMATDADSGLDTFDYTKLSAINTCIRWGLIRYAHHKVMPGGRRAMALEAGSLLHQCFSVVRLFSLGVDQGKMDHMMYHGARLFGADRWDAISAALAASKGDDQTAVRNMTLECLATGGYVDDPFDKRRTYANLETALLYYIQRWDRNRYPVWYRSDDPTESIGVEVPFAIHITAQLAGGGVRRFLYTGRVDGIHTDKSGELVVQENKTASRLGEAWRMSFDTSHQVTGYCVAGSLFTGAPVSRGLVIGLMLPLPVRSLSDALVVEDVRRPPHMKEQWVTWLEHTIAMHDKYMADPLSAPLYTHSCNRYFMPCSFIPICASDPEEQRAILNEMEVEEWSPLHESNA
jgi:hypothetical protein